MFSLISELKFALVKLSLSQVGQKCILICFLLLVSSCSPSSRQNYPTNVNPIGFIPPLSPVTPEDEKYGHELLAKLSEKYKLDFSHPRRTDVDTIVQKLTSSIGGSNQPWHVNVFADNSVKNAAATKGNNIFVWTGMIDATQNNDELAAILAHEIGHILAHHTESSNGDTAREVIVGIGSMVAGTAVQILTNGAIGSDIASQLASSLTKEVGSGILIYPYSREKETEADEIGLFLMTKAGFSPQAAIDFWTRAENDPDFSASIPFFSTHPLAKNRLEHLKKLLPYALNPNGIPSSKPPAPQSPLGNPQQMAPKTQTPTATLPKLPADNLSNSDSFDIRK